MLCSQRPLRIWNYITGDRSCLHIAHHMYNQTWHFLTKSTFVSFEKLCTYFVDEISILNRSILFIQTRYLVRYNLQPPSHEQTENNSSKPKPSSSPILTKIINIDSHLFDPLCAKKRFYAFWAMYSENIKQKCKRSINVNINFVGFKHSCDQ